MYHVPVQLDHAASDHIQKRGESSMGWEFDILKRDPVGISVGSYGSAYACSHRSRERRHLLDHGRTCFTLYKKTRTFGICILTALVFEVLSCNVILKPLVARPRPFTSDPARSFRSRPEDYSFPSDIRRYRCCSVSRLVYEEEKNRCGFLGASHA